MQWEWMEWNKDGFYVDQEMPLSKWHFDLVYWPKWKKCLRSNMSFDIGHTDEPQCAIAIKNQIMDAC